MATAYSPLTVSNGLVFYVDAGNSRSYPGTGTTWYDLTNNVNMGASNTTTLTYGTSAGGYFNFKNLVAYQDSFYQTLLSASPVQSQQYYTIDAFFTASVSPSGNTNLCLCRVGLYADEVMSLYCSTNNSTQTITGLSNQWVSGGNFQGSSSNTISIPFNTWTHACVTNNSGAYSFYINGIYVGGSLSTGLYANVTAGAMKVGGSGSNAQDYTGNIANVKIYNRALSPTEVYQNYNALRGRYGL
jgi:Concanavalin A-like lectin/glucanases superfamily